jgi:hypothetical protein
VTVTVTVVDCGLGCCSVQAAVLVLGCGARAFEQTHLRECLDGFVRALPSRDELAPLGVDYGACRVTSLPFASFASLLFLFFSLFFLVVIIAFIAVVITFIIIAPFVLLLCALSTSLIPHNRYRCLQTICRT